MALIDGLTSYHKADTDGSFPDATGSYDGTISGATDLYNVGSYGTLLWMQGSTLKFQFASSTGEAATATLSTGTWYHIVCTYDGTNLKIYRNAVNDNTGTGTPNYTSAGNWNIGRGGDYNGFYSDCEVDEIGIWSRTLSASEVTELYNASNGLSYPLDVTLTNSLISYYKADEDGSFPDAHGSNDGTIDGATYNATGKINGAYSFDGINDTVGLGDTFNPSSGDTISWSAWVKPSSSPNNSAIIGAGYKGLIGVWTNKITFAYYPSADHIYSTTVDLTDNVWNHVVVSYTYGTGSSAKIYLNGNLLSGSWAYGDGNTAPPTSSEPLQIGQSTQYLTSYFPGDIDEVGIWDRELLQSEVTNLYNSGSGLQYPFGPGPTPSVGLTIFGILMSKVNGISFTKMNGV